MRLLGAHVLSLSILLAPSTAAPQPQPQSQTSLNDLKALNIPKCALQCLIDALSNDGCSSETDFSCHCTEGKVLSSATSCVDRACSASDKTTAFAQIRGGCKAVGVSISDGTSPSPSTSPSNSAPRPANSQAGGNRPVPSQQPSTTPLSSTSSISSETPNPTTSTIPSATPSPTPTDTPLALSPTSHSLSIPAKAGISVSVTLVLSAILLSIILYIRRLKRDLRAAQAAAGIPESVWRAHVSTAAAAGPVAVSRRKSWLGRRSGEWPVSPLSPVQQGGGGGWGNADMGGMGPGMGGGMKKKRGHVLSVVVERAEEDDTSTIHNRFSNSHNSDSESTHRIMPREPVPGQKEGLADALELDGEGTLVVEAPTSITPKGVGTPNRGRSRERGGSFEFGSEAGPSESWGFDFGEWGRGRFGEESKDTYGIGHGMHKSIME